MKLNQIFAKNIARQLNGVVKISDTPNFDFELDEYVLTPGMAKRLGTLLEEYINSSNSPGVWISGFFGSGKTQLLKTLAHLLGEVPGQNELRENIAERILTKTSASFLPPLLKKSCQIPAKSILLDLTPQTPLQEHAKPDALLQLFMKTFDDSCGYYGNQGHIARFERDLEIRGQYEFFKNAYAHIAQRPWELGRADSFQEEWNIVQAYAMITGTEPDSQTTIITKYRNEHTVSIDSFTNAVKFWLSKRSADFRLNFFVDEVGSFIGSNPDSLVNLQTLTESLHAKCPGQAWLFATAPKSIEQIVADPTPASDNDYSKLQTSFANRITLTGAEITEVIHNRLLKKNPNGQNELDQLHNSRSEDFRILFNFASNAKKPRNYPDKNYFINTYPFVPYQFPLFQTVLTGLFENKHFVTENNLAKEFSLLTVLQNISRNLINSEVGILVSFDQLFAGIRHALKPSAQPNIAAAEQNLDNILAIKLLKILLLVQHIRGFDATVRNLTVLAYDRSGPNLPTLAKQVQEALTLLENKHFIKRHGNKYEYLTNESRQIATEIEQVALDLPDINLLINELIATEILQTNKLRHTKTAREFVCGLKFDDLPYGEPGELTLNFISPNFNPTPEDIRPPTATRDELRIVLAPDPGLICDLVLFLKTRQYLNLKESASLTALEYRLLESQAASNARREKEILERVRRMVSNAKMFINATAIEAKSTQTLARIEEGFQELVDRNYPQLALLAGTRYRDSQLETYLNPNSEAELTSDETQKTSEIAAAVLGYIRPGAPQGPGRPEKPEDSGIIQAGREIQLKEVCEYFARKPYGWTLASIQCALAHLVAREEIVFKTDGSPVERAQVAVLLRDTQKFPFVTISPPNAYDIRTVQLFRAFCIDYFDDEDVPADPTELALFGKTKLAELQADLIATYQKNRTDYPFLIVLEDTLALLEQVTGHENSWYFAGFLNSRDPLLDDKEAVVDPIRQFLNGPAKTVYDSAATLVENQRNNLSYLESGIDTTVKELLDDPQAFRDQKIAALKQARIELAQALEEKLLSSREAELATLSDYFQHLTTSDLFLEASETLRRKISALLEYKKQQLAAESQIALIKHIGSDFKDKVYPKLVDILYAESGATSYPPSRTEPNPKSRSRSRSESGSRSESRSRSDSGPRTETEPRSRTSTTPVPAQPAAAPFPISTVSIRQIPMHYSRTILESSDELDQYLDSYRTILLEQLNNGKRISL